MPLPPLLSLHDIHLSLGQNPLLDGANLTVGAGDRIALVGRNGSGKSTLLRIAAGLIGQEALEGDRGVRFAQPGATIRYLPQEPDLLGFATVGEYVRAGLGPGDDPHRATTLMDELSLTGEEDPSVLSGGEARRAALARVLAPAPDLLLLDEPTNHLDLPAIEWLDRTLGALRSGIVLISHDRRLLERLSRATVWLDRGKTRRLEQGFAAFETWRDEVLEAEEQARHKLGRKIAMEEDWLRYGVTARRKRNQKRLADLHGLRAKRREQRSSAAVLNAGVKMAASDSDLSGKLVAVAEHATKSYDGRPVVLDFSGRVLRGDRVGIVGPNGAGKTTLLRLLTGDLLPDAGEVRLGASLSVVTLDQRRESLDPAASLADTLTGTRGGDQVIVNGKARHVIGYMKDFLFTPEQAGTPVGVLSGGERGRLMLARALAAPSNLLVLDEPTNDLDLETLDLLQELLADYPGTVLLVSHDRDFLDRVATVTIASEGGGRWVEYAGGYSDMLAQRGGGASVRSGADAAPTAPRPRAAQSSSGAGRTGSRKLTFSDRHALETLPARIATLSDDINRLAGALSDPTLYSRDPARFARLTEELAAAEAARTEAEDRWLELEVRREEIEG